MAYVAIVDENRTVLAHSDVAEIGKPIARPPGLESLSSEPLIRTYKTKPRGEIIDFAMPLVFSERRGRALSGLSRGLTLLSPGPSTGRHRHLDGVLGVLGRWASPTALPPSSGWCDDISLAEGTSTWRCR